ncbi:hypothetical protein [Hylemonella gracilis]|uniref:hypothetical protein n=1 Tax=Hylemonella gracilis TaxID=80880 RepID=UPI001110CE04|nr:hypothetical protein [Hylemonella gracilis]
MNKSVLEALKKLQLERGGSSPFPSHTEFLRWSDQVAPLLSFDSTIQSEFKQTVRTADVSSKLGSPNDATGSINRAIGLLNQAVVTLELSVTQQVATSNAIAPKSGDPELPNKLTIKWLYEHTPVSFYAWLLGLLLAAFMGGVAFSETPLYAALKGSPPAQHAVPAPVNSQQSIETQPPY